MGDSKIIDEGPEADVLEQSIELEPGQERPHGPLPDEANEADATDQQWEVDVTDEY